MKITDIEIAQVHVSNLRSLERFKENLKDFPKGGHVCISKGYNTYNRCSLANISLEITIIAIDLQIKKELQEIEKLGATI